MKHNERITEIIFFVVLQQLFGIMAPKRKASNNLAATRKSRPTSNGAIVDSGRHLDETQPNKNCAILTLPNECLLKILGYISLNDLYAVGDCHNRFRVLADRAAKVNCRVEIFKYLNPNEENAAILKRFGRFMQNVESSVGNSLAWLQKCTSLKTLKLRETELIFGWECARTLNKLENLTLELCDLEFFRGYKYYPTFRHAAMIQACKKLKSISIIQTSSFPYQYTDLLECVTGMVNIERISLNFYLHSMPSHDCTKEIAMRMLQRKKLKFLNLVIPDPDYDEFINTLSGSESLEELHLKVRSLNDDVLRALDAFPNLKTCEIVYETDKPYGRHPIPSYKTDILENKLKHFHYAVSTDRSKQTPKCCAFIVVLKRKK